MLPNPLHPAIVHFPVVLAVLLPLFVVGAAWAMRRGAPRTRAWLLPLAVAAALAVSAWVAVETGEEQEERVEHVVARQPMHAHQELAEAFFVSSIALAVISAGGLLAGVAGRAARIATLVGSIGLTAGALRVGHTGGQLVYRYGAARAYEPSASNQAAMNEQRASGVPRRERERGE